MRYAATFLIIGFVLSGCSRKPSEQPAETKPQHKEDTVEIGLEAQKHIGLQTAPVALSQMTEYRRVTGTVQPIDNKVVHIRPLARGRVTTVSVRIGDRVAAGQELALMDNVEASEAASELASARAELQRLRVQLAAHTRQTDRQRKLSEIGAAPVKDYEAVRAEQQATEELIRAQESTIAGLTTRLRRLGAGDSTPTGIVTTAVRAPFSGVVTKAEAAAGSVVGQENELFTIADLSHVWVQAEVYEKDLGRLRLRQPAFIRVDTYPDVRFSGKVTYISDILDPQTRTARVRCEVPNTDVRLKLDMFATVELPTTFSRTAINVPTSAIQQLEGKNVVFIRTSATVFEVRGVELGNQVGEQVEIINGVKENESVVTQGAFHLKSVLAGKELGEEH